MVVALQVPFMPLLARFRRTRSIVGGGFGYVCSYLLFATTPLLPQSFWVPYLVLSIIIYTLAEMFLSPSSSALALALAPERMRGRYMAFYGLTWTLAWTLAPTLFTALLALSPSFFWLFFAALTGAAALLVLLFERWLPAKALQATREDPSNAPAPFVEVGVATIPQTDTSTCSPCAKNC
jgi:MFS family permease